MKNWSPLLRQGNVVIRLNTSLAVALTHCPTLAAAGWNFHCVECHVSTGTYPAGFGCGWHSHNEYQLEIALSGAFQFETARRKKLLLRAGHALVIPWKSSHRWKCLRPGAMLGVSLELQPSPESIRQDGWLVRGIRPLAHPAIRARADELVQAGLEEAPSAYHTQAVACRVFLLLSEVMSRLFPGKQPGSNAPGPRVAPAARGREAVGWVVRYLEENIAADINLGRMAKATGMSSRNLHRLFVKHVGKSLHAYLLDHRLDQARRMLMDQGRKAMVKEIAFACGFNSLAYFSNSFRKAYGVAPSSLLVDDVRLKSGFTYKSDAPPGSRSRRRAR